MKGKKIWELGYVCGDKIYVEALDIEEAIQGGLDFAQEKFDKEKKENKDFDENEFAESFRIEHVVLYVETDY